MTERDNPEYVQTARHQMAQAHEEMEPDEFREHALEAAEMVVRLRSYLNLSRREALSLQETHAALVALEIETKRALRRVVTMIHRGNLVAGVEAIRKMAEEDIPAPWIFDATVYAPLDDVDFSKR